MLAINIDPDVFKEQLEISFPVFLSKVFRGKYFHRKAFSANKQSDYFFPPILILSLSNGEGAGFYQLYYKPTLYQFEKNIFLINRVAPDTELAGYPANLFVRYPAEQLKGVTKKQPVGIF